MKVIYIASPYSVGDVAANVLVQIETAHQILDLGHCPIAPLLSHFLHIYRQRPIEDWYAMDTALLGRADALLRLPGDSVGADEEVKEAKRMAIPVLYGWESLTAWLGLTASVQAHGFLKG